MESVSKDAMQRSKWVEQYAAEFAAVPFVREFVFPNPQHVRKGLQKEVCDLLIALHGRALVGQIKAQENPEERAEARLPAWIRKKADEAAKQLSGTLKTLSSTNVWCDHARRGRVELNAGTLAAEHGLILIECGAGTRLDELQDDVPLEVRGVPLAYFDASDFLNVVQQLRSYKDVERYLAGRRTLGDDVRRGIGGEQIVLEHYVLNGGTFAAWPGYEEARRIANADRPARDNLFRDKQRRDVSASFVEYIADALAERLSNYTEGLDAATIRLFDADESRKQYLLMQEVLADVSLVGRRQLGGALLETFGPPGVEKPPCIYRAVDLDELPAFVFVAVSTSGIPRQEVITRALILLRAALAYYGWRDGMVIVDRDTLGFEIALIRGFVLTEADAVTAREQFANLRVDHLRDRLV